jgi:hypothetical protein
LFKIPVSEESAANGKYPGFVEETAFVVSGDLLAHIKKLASGVIQEFPAPGVFEFTV